MNYKCPICRECFMNNYSSHDHIFGKYTAVYHIIGSPLITVWTDNPKKTKVNDPEYIHLMELNGWTLLDESRIEKLLLLK